MQKFEACTPSGNGARSCHGCQHSQTDTQVHTDTCRDMQRFTVKMNKFTGRSERKDRFLPLEPRRRRRHNETQNAIIKTPELFFGWPRARMIDGTMTHPSIPGPQNPVATKQEILLARPLQEESPSNCVTAAWKKRPRS